MTAAVITAVILSLAVLGGILFPSGSMIQAQEGRIAGVGSSGKMYSSIRIQKGDTLWAIAGRFMDSHYGSIQEYIDEVKYINELPSDTIHEDAYLLVPYYDSPAENS